MTALWRRLRRALGFDGLPPRPSLSDRHDPVIRELRHANKQVDRALQRRGRALLGDALIPHDNEGGGPPQ